MISNYFKTAFRGLIKYKEYSIINVLGLAIGMACVILILLFVREELSFDRFHKNKDRIYRINIAVTNPQTGEVRERAIGPYRLAQELKPDFPDFAAIIRITPQGRELVEYQDKRFWEEGLAFVEPDIFQVFTFPLLKGDPAAVLNDPYSVVITGEIAKKYFGAEEPIGKVLTFQEHDFKVTGILAEIPKNSQFHQLNMCASMKAGEQLFSRIVKENWGEGSSETFVMLEKGKSPGEYRERLAAFVEAKLGAWRQASPQLKLQPLTELYLYSKNIATFLPGGDITYVYAFSIIAAFILIIACINFMNLATARSANRAKEVGLRKVVGAKRSQLIGQFLCESLILAILSMFVALILLIFALPAFNGIAGRELSINIFKNSSLLLGVFIIALFVGLLAGSYPSLFLSRFKPVGVLSGNLTRGVKGGWLRKVLVTFQFAVSIFLIVLTAVVYRQLEYSRKINVGFNKEHLVLLPGTPVEFRTRYNQFRTELLSNPNIINAAASSRVPPGRLRSSLTARPEGVPEDQQEGMQTVWTDFDFIETLGLEMAAGRSFSRELATDVTSAFIINEAAVKKIGWTNESAIGKSFGSAEIKDWDSGQWQRKDGHVIGVLKDFHFESVHQKIVPTVYFIAPYMAWNYVIRIRPENISETLKFIEKKWNSYNPTLPFVYQFVDENFDNLYRVETIQGKIFATFAVLAIFIACLGLIGLASFTAEQRTKEVGIRKVLGASVRSVVLLFTREFTLLVIFGFIFAVPVTWYILSRWLQDFAYHIRLGYLVFCLAGTIALVIAWLTVSYQAIKVALTNPADTLRYE